MDNSFYPRLLSTFHNIRVCTKDVIGEKVIPSGESGVWYFTLKISKIRKVSTASKMKHVTTFYSLYKFLFLLFYACVRCTKFTNVWREVIIIINNFSIVDQWKIIYSRKLDRIVAILRYDYTHIRYEQPRIQPALSFLFFFFRFFSIVDYRFSYSSPMRIHK